MAKITIRRNGSRILTIGRTALDSQREWALLGRVALRIESGEATAAEIRAAGPVAERKMRELGVSPCER